MSESEHRQSVYQYVRACKALLEKADELSEHEMQVVQDMMTVVQDTFTRYSEKMIDGRADRNP